MSEEYLNNIVTGALRTFVPVLVGSFVAWLGTVGIIIEPTVKNQLVAALILFLVPICTGIYYVGVRLLAHKFPWVEKLLGSSQTPKYEEK